jgi:hypothetical protein
MSEKKESKKIIEVGEDIMNGQPTRIEMDLSKIQSELKQYHGYQEEPPKP